jgi:catechol 2,3-dioxygenase-like lactoylglutathione lyase family enzyme
MSEFPSPTATATVARVRDLEASIAWYRTHLDLEPVHVYNEGDHPIAAYLIGTSVWVLWQLEAGNAGLGLEQRDVAPYLSIVVADDLDELRERFDRRGVLVTAVRSSANNKFFFACDPDGNRFEFARPATDDGRAAASKVQQEQRRGSTP